MIVFQHAVIDGIGDHHPACQRIVPMLARESLGVEYIVERQALPIECFGQFHRLTGTAAEALCRNRSAKAQCIADVDIGVPIVEILFTTGMGLGENYQNRLDHDFCPTA